MRNRWLLAALVVVLVWGWAPQPAHAEQRCFVETNQCIDGRIREFWEKNGGLAVFGLPIAPQGQFTVDGKPLVGQRFERNRLELHPENARPYDVLIGRLGATRLTQQGRDWFSFAKSSDTGGCRVFAETGHAICGDILQAWRANGLQLDGKKAVSDAESLALFGMPLSGVMTETLSDGKQYQVQWFERARFELHPENPAPYNVLLGLLGSEDKLFRAKPVATAVPAATAIPAATAVPTVDRLVVTAEQFAFRLHDMPAGYWTTYGHGVTVAAGGIRFHRELYWWSASTGNKLVRMSVNIRNDRAAGGDSVYLNPWQFTLVDVEGRHYTYSPATYQLDNIIDSRALWPGQQGGGDIVFEIPKGTSPYKMLYEYAYAKSPIVLVFDNNVHQ